MNKVQAACGFLMIASVSACGSSNSNGDGGGGTGGETPIPVAAEGATAMTASTLTDVLATLASMDAAIVDGTVAAPATEPTGRADLNGFVSIETPDDAVIVGNLVIDANFDSGRVTSRASGFAEVAIDSDGAVSDANTLGLTGESELTGAGVIVDGQLDSTLIGALSTTTDDLPLDLDLHGDIYDHGGLLAIRGFVIGTVDRLTIKDDSEFVVSE